MKSQKTLLVTGGAGYIGAVLCEHAASLGFKVNILDNLDSQNKVLEKLLLNPNVNYFQGSILDEALIKKSLENVNFVVHLAAVSDGRAGKANPELTKKVNIEALEQLVFLSKATGIERFIFASTMGVYGNQYLTPLDETLILNPVDPYSESKAHGEDIVSKAFSSDFTTCILRLAMAYGISLSMRFDFIVNRLVIDALQKKRITIMGGGQKRPQVHINDLSLLFIKLLSFDKKMIGNQCFNVVGENPSINEIAEIILNKLPDVVIEKLPSRELEDSFEMDGSKLITVTQFKYLKNIRIGIEEMINRYGNKNLLILD